MVLPNIITLNITEVHIKVGECRDCYECPVALALLQFLQQHKYPGYGVGVNTYDAQIWDGITLKARYAVDRTGINFIEAFDERLRVQPTTVTLTKVN